MLSAAELTRLWRKHAAALLLMARSRCGTVAADQADDCVQEAFIRLAAQQTVPDDPAAWLVRVVRNAAIDAVRSQRRRVDRETQSASRRLTWLEPVDAAALDDPSADAIQHGLQLLDSTTRDIVVAHLWNDMTFRQIAEAFDLSPATTHRKYETGIAALRVILANASASSAEL